MLRRRTTTRETTIDATREARDAKVDRAAEAANVCGKFVEWLIGLGETIRIASFEVKSIVLMESPSHGFGR